MTPPQPYRVRALDGNGKPVAGLKLTIMPTSFTGFPQLFDEFNYRAFNANWYETLLGPVPPEYIAYTDANGIASAQGTYRDPARADTIIAAADFTNWHNHPTAFFSVVMTHEVPAGKPSVLVEYVYTNGHYFNTLLQSEIDALEAGQFPGWSRSIGSFIGYAAAQDAPAGAVPVCRFFSSRYASHFYTADPAECQAVIDRWPETWTLETREAFWIFEPNKATGQCATGLIPIYRLFSTRNGPSHRYVTDRSLRNTMVGAGWIAEGYGPDAVMLCTPG